MRIQIAPALNVLAAMGGILLFVCGAAPANAQYESPIPVQYRLRLGALAKGNAALLVYPYAHFSVSSGDRTASRTGSLYAAEVGYSPDQERGPSYALGGWIWKPSHTDLYEVHAKCEFTPQFGVQAGFLGSSKVGGHPYDAFFLYNVSTRPRPKRNPGDTTPPPTPLNGIDFQIGSGLYVDPTSGETTTGFTAFASAAVTVLPRLSLNGSYWYINNRGTASRTALGLGYQF